MLVSNPQLDYSYPSLLWELEVHGGGYDARGVGVPGIPTVGIGHNADVAWGLTTGYSKTIDSYIETTRPNPAAGGPPQYLHDGRWQDESCRTETIRYRAAADGVPAGPPSFSKDYRICRTVHGPVVATTDDGTRARTVDYAMWKHEVDTVEGILRWDRARSLDDVAAGVRQVTWNENIVAADRYGHIGYWHPGRYPRRAAGVDQRFPLDGRGGQDSRGLLRFGRMPHVVDPAPGFVANWNTKPARGWVDGDLSGSNSRPGGPLQRVLVIKRLLRHGHRLRLPDLMRIDTHAGEDDHRAAGYLPPLLALRDEAGLSRAQRRALRLLAHWDGRAYAPGDPGGSVTGGDPGRGRHRRAGRHAVRRRPQPRAAPAVRRPARRRPGPAEHAVAREPPVRRHPAGQPRDAGPAARLVRPAGADRRHRPAAPGRGAAERTGRRRPLAAQAVRRDAALAAAARHQPHRDTHRRRGTVRAGTVRGPGQLGAAGGLLRRTAALKPLVVTSRLVVPPHELHWRFSRSGGPGGQSVNTSDSRVELSVDVENSTAFPPVLRDRARRRLGDRLVDGRVTVAASEHRSQLRNREAALARMAELLRDAVAPPAAPRRRTRPTAASRERRLADKRRRGDVKKLRRQSSDD